MSSTRPVRVAVVGAGIGGLAAAVALRSVGVRVDVYEQASRFARVGAGLQLGPNATGVLRGLGLLDEVSARACRPVAWRSLDAIDGSTRVEFPLGDAVVERYGAPYLHVHRGDLHEVLLLAAGSVRTGYRVTGLDSVPSGVRVRFADGSSVLADAVIGADGLHSTVRAVLFGATAARFSGMVAYRGLVGGELAREVEPVAVKWWGPDRHLVHYWISGGRELNFVAAVPAEQWAEESWTARGSTTDLVRALDGFCAAARYVPRAATTVLRSALYDRDPLPRWSAGRATLLGDACHPMLPFMAQGAGMALEDAVVLGRCLAGVGPDEVPAALTRYQRARLERTAAVQAGSRGNTFLRAAAPASATAPATTAPASADVYAYDAWTVDLPAS